MAKNIPQNKIILKQNGYGKSLGDISSSFNLDLTSNYGAIRTTGMKLVTSNATQTDLDVPVSFQFYNGSYYALCDDFVFRGGDVMSDAFQKDTRTNAPDGEPNDARDDMKVFNGSLYVSSSTEVFKLTGSTWSSPVTTGITSSVHLLEAWEDRLYITNGGTKVFSINTSDVISATGTATFDTKLNNDEWAITMIKASSSSLWIGLLNYKNGEGLVYQWDGETENTYTNLYKVPNGVAAGVIKDNIPYIMDFSGKLLAFSGGSFQEVGRLFKEKKQLFYGSSDSNNDRFMHPNGMSITPNNTIKFLISNQLNNVTDFRAYENDIPSGIYEYDPQIGIYHNYSPSYSAVNTTTVTDYGQQRLDRNTTSGALYVRYANQINEVSDNGTLLAGFRYQTNASAGTNFGIFIDDNLDTTQKFGYLVTTRQQAEQVIETWKSVYASYKRLNNATDKIVVKYRTDELPSTEATITWVTESSFTTTTNISAYGEDNEVQVIQGRGSGKSSQIATISEAGGTYTVTLDDSYAGASGTAKCLLSNFKKAGEISIAGGDDRWKEMPTNQDNISYWIQYKVCLQFTGENELYRIRAINEVLV